MTTEFERVKQVVSGRSILITSWYDDRQKSWRASAPAYAHLHTLFSPGASVCESRKAAVDRIVGILTNHFDHNQS